METGLQVGRIRSIDAMRGLTILVMIWVNQMAGVRDISPWLKHMPANADAMTFVDVVFPAFLFIVGMSIPFAIETRLQRGEAGWRLWRHILSRTLALLVLGLFMVNAEMGHDAQAMPLSIHNWLLLVFVCAILVWNAYPPSLPLWWVRGLRSLGLLGLVLMAWLYVGADGGPMRAHWWGILGLIGWAYFYACIIYLASGRGLRIALLSVLALVGFYMLVNSSVWPGGRLWSMLGSQAGNAAHASIVMSGVAVSLLLFNTSALGRGQRLWLVLAFALCTILLGLVVRPYYPISKIYASPSWVFLSVAACTFIYLLLYYLIDTRKLAHFAEFLQPAAANPLLIYILPYMLYAVTLWLGISLMPEFARSGTPGIVYTALYALALLWVVKWFNRMHLRLHL